MDKTGAGTQLELVMFESHVTDTPQSDVSPTSDIQVSLYFSFRLFSLPYVLYILELCYCEMAWYTDYVFHRRTLY